MCSKLCRFNCQNQSFIRFIIDWTDGPIYHTLYRWNSFAWREINLTLKFKSHQHFSRDCFLLQTQHHRINLVRSKISEFVRPKLEATQHKRMWKCAHDKFSTQTNLVCHCRDGATDQNALRSTQAAALSSDRWAVERKNEAQRKREFDVAFAVCDVFILILRSAAADRKWTH